MCEHLHPHRALHRLVDVDARELIEQGICGVIIDLDNTLTAWRGTTVTTEVERWIANLRELGLAACVVSNAATAARVRPVADRLGLPWVTRAIKPLAGGFRRGMALMGTDPSSTAVIGDQIFTDVWGGNRLGLYTILVDPVSNRESLFTILLQRPLERWFGRTPKDQPR